MRFYISNTSLLHKQLSSLPIPQELSDSIEMSESPKSEKSEPSILSTPVNLPSPLYRAKIEFSRENDRDYSARVIIEAANSSAFAGASEKLAKLVKGFDFYSTNSDGLGYFYRPNGDSTVEPLVSLNSIPGFEGIHPTFRLISIGSEGAQSRQLLTPEEFSNDLTDLLIVTNCFVEACTDKTSKPRNLSIPLAGNIIF